MLTQRNFSFFPFFPPSVGLFLCAVSLRIERSFHLPFPLFLFLAPFILLLELSSFSNFPFLSFFWLLVFLFISALLPLSFLLLSSVFYTCHWSFLVMFHLSAYLLYHCSRLFLVFLSFVDVVDCRLLFLRAWHGYVCCYN